MGREVTDTYIAALLWQHYAKHKQHRTVYELKNQSTHQVLNYKQMNCDWTSKFHESQEVIWKTYTATQRGKDYYQNIHKKKKSAIRKQNKIQQGQYHLGREYASVYNRQQIKFLKSTKNL